MPKAATLTVEIGAKIDKFEKSLGKVRKDLKGMETRLGGVSRGASKATTAFSGMAKRLIAVGVAYFGARGIFRMAKSFLDVATSVETYKLRLEAMLGSQQAATEAMAYFKEVAAKVPFTLEEVIEAGVKVQAFGADLKKWTPIMADLAAFMGVTLPEAAGALGRAFAGGAGAADIFRERGILQVIRDFAKMDKGIDDITKLSLPKFREVMYEAFAGAESKVAGTADKLAETWVGVISMLQDKWFKFRDTVMKTKIFELLKEGLVSFNESMDEFVETGGLELWAKDMAIAVIDAFRVIVKGIEGLMFSFQVLKAAIYGAISDLTVQMRAYIEKLIIGFGLLEQLGVPVKKILSDLITEWANLVAEESRFNETIEETTDKMASILTSFDTLKEKLKAVREEVVKSKDSIGGLGDKAKKVGSVMVEIAYFSGPIIPEAAITKFKADLGYILKLNENWAEEMKKIQEEILRSFAFIFSSMAQAVGNFFSQIGAFASTHYQNQINYIDSEYDKRKKAIDASTMDDEAKYFAIEKLEREMALKKKAIQKRAFESQKKISLITAAINIAEAITKALTGAIPPWNIILASITAAAGAIQLAAISSQSFPSLAEGGLIPRPMPVIAGHGPRGEIIASPEKLAEIISREMPGIGSPGMGLAPIQPIVNIYARTLDRYTVDRASEMILDALEREQRRRG